MRLLRGCAPQSLHLFFLFPCVQKALPPHSLHCALILMCGQTPLPPHSLHVPLIRPCGQMPLPPHSLHCDFCLPCEQMPLPLHCLHMDLSLPWMQTATPPHCLHLLFCFPCGQPVFRFSTSVEDAGVAPADRHARLRQQWHRTTNNQTCCALHNVRSAVAPRANCAVPHRACYVGILWKIIHFDVLCVLRGVRKHIRTR